MSQTLTFNGPELAALAKALGGLGDLNFTKPVRKAAQVLVRDWKRRIPRPGYPGDKTPEAALQTSMRAKVKHVQDKNLYYAVVGSDTSTGAHHSHLVEEVHRIVSHGTDTGKRTKAGKYGEQAVAATQRERDDTILSEITKAVRLQATPGAST